jgi:hypothetical protein
LRIHFLGPTTRLVGIHLDKYIPFPTPLDALQERFDRKGARRLSRQQRPTKSDIILHAANFGKVFRSWSSTSPGRFPKSRSYGGAIPVSMCV